MISESAKQYIESWKEHTVKRGWYPLLFPKQLKVFNSRARALLVPGPRLSGKTKAVLARVARHLWEIDRARVGMFVRTMKSSKNSGSWDIMVNTTIPEWNKSGIGMRFTTENNGVPGPKTDGITRVPFFKVRNRHGTESEMQLFSIDNDADAEEKLKEMNFSLIYFSELDKFFDRKMLTVALPSLRLEHVRFEDMMWIADCNPSEEGEQSWIYKVFYEERRMTYQQYQEHQKENELPFLDERDFVDVYGQLDVIEILPEDNIFIDPRQLQEVKVACGSDLGLFARYVKGQWVWGGGDASRHFRTIFRPHVHVVGDISSADEREWTYINPRPESFELTTGWDLGDTFHAACVLDRYIRSDGKLCFAMLDELVHIGSGQSDEVSLEDFTDGFMELIEALEDQAQKQFSLERAWSDRSTIDRYSAAAATYPYLVVHRQSRERIFLRGTPKGQNSVKYRVQVLKMLLVQERFKVSAHCLKTIQMLRDLKKGKSRLHYVQPDENKHIFDALTYALIMELAEELESEEFKNDPGRRKALATQI